MLTSRGFSFLMVVGFVCFWGLAIIGAYVPIIGLLGVTLLGWFVGQWLWFRWQVANTKGSIAIDRRLKIAGREVPNLWVGSPATVEVTLRWTTKHGTLHYVVATDRLPEGQERTTGSRIVKGSFSRQAPLKITYSIAPQVPGVAHFEGVEVRMADLCGLFYTRVFLREPTEYLILPPLSDDEATQRTMKRLNGLPPPGVHRLRRPGGGSELLDLREYRPGDPPKCIAWKASARREFLITKEYENDVPVRVTFFLDCSNSMRVGEVGRTPLAEVTRIAGAVTQAAMANRDIVGLCLADETSCEVMKPARTRVHTMMMLRRLAEVAGRMSTGITADYDTTHKYCQSLAQELYPDLLTKAANSRPITLYWIPLLDSRAKWFLLAPFVFGYWLFTRDGFNTIVGWVRNIVQPGAPEDLFFMLIVFVIIVGLPFTLTMFYWYAFSSRGFWPSFRRVRRERKQLATLWASQDHDTPLALERYLNDDKAYVDRGLKFLEQHKVQPPPELYDENGNYRYLSPEKLLQLRDALIRAVGTAKDNELFILCVDVIELAEQLEPLLKAIRAAVGRHHQVLVLLPWPSELPVEDWPLDPNVRISLSDLIEERVANEYRRKFQAAKLALVRAGARVVRFTTTDAVQLILQQIEQIRTARIRR